LKELVLYQAFSPIHYYHIISVILPGFSSSGLLELLNFVDLRTTLT
jgi:hypothetical protein